MILKIQCRGWVVYDNIDKIRYYRDRENNRAIEESHLVPDATWISGPRKDTLKIITRIKNEEFTIETNGSTFLCNDEGKTIEKLF